MTINYLSDKQHFLIHVFIGLNVLIAVLTLYRQGMLLTITLILFSILLLSSNLPDRKVIIYYLGGAIIFPICEILATSTGMFGIWHYMYHYDQILMIQTDFMTIPLWLFPLWGIVTVIVRTTKFEWIIGRTDVVE